MLPKASCGHLNWFSKAAVLDSFPIYFNTVCGALQIPIHVATSSFQKSFQDFTFSLQEKHTGVVKKSILKNFSNSDIKELKKTKCTDFVY
jgi:hypothetical protein